MTMNIITNIGNSANKLKFIINSLDEKSDNIAIKIWPAVKLAANLKPKAIGLEMKLAISIITNKGERTKGDPFGINILK